MNQTETTSALDLDDELDAGEIEEPETEEECREWMAEAKTELIALQGTIGDRDRCHPDGTRYTNREYWTWRATAVVKITNLTQEVVRLKEFLAKFRTAKAEAKQERLGSVQEAQRLLLEQAGLSERDLNRMNYAQRTAAVREIAATTSDADDLLLRMYRLVKTVVSTGRGVLIDDEQTYVDVLELWLRDRGLVD